MTENKKINSYRDLIVWQKSIVLGVEVYKLTENFPKGEMYGLISQMRRSAVSISSNIAEGKARSTRKDFSQFLRIAYGSGAELETQIEISKKLGFIRTDQTTKVDSNLDEIMRMLNVIIKKLSANT